MSGKAEVKITLDGIDHVMKPTYGAAKGINRHFGGLRAALEEVTKLNADAMEVIIAYGLDLTPRGQKEMKLGERIYEQGIPHCAAPCVEFLTLLMNGGKPISEDKSEGREDTGEQ